MTNGRGKEQRLDNREITSLDNGRGQGLVEENWWRRIGGGKPKAPTILKG